MVNEKIINESRNSFFPKLINEREIKRGVELGVAKGDFSVCLLKKSKLQMLYSIDCWRDRGHNLRQYFHAVSELDRFGERSVTVRMSFEEAAEHWPFGLVDFIYVDGYAHDGQECGMTFEQWWPLLNNGGILAGHDYHDDWPLTKRFVQFFAFQHGYDEINVVDKDKYSSWYIIKK